MAMFGGTQRGTASAFYDAASDAVVGKAVMPRARLADHVGMDSRVPIKRSVRGNGVPQNRWMPGAAAWFFVLSAGCAAQAAEPPPRAGAVASAPVAVTTNLSGATINFAPNDPPGEWHRQARDYANTRYSPLNQVNITNVGRLKMAWSFADGIAYGHEAAPLVVGGTMYLVTPFPQHRLCARPDQARRADQMDLSAAPQADRGRQGLLRCSDCAAHPMPTASWFSRCWMVRA